MTCFCVCMNRFGDGAVSETLPDRQGGTRLTDAAAAARCACFVCGLDCYGYFTCVIFSNLICFLRLRVCESDLCNVCL